jgi:hypothetical protein
MKVSIGSKIKSGPWGGGNLFVVNLKNFLESQNHEVVFNLDDADIDIILMTDPRFISESSSFDYLDVKLYKKLVNPNSVVIHRINECDERKNTKNLNKFMLKANNVSNYTIFVSSWIKNLYREQGHNKPSSVIMSGSDTSIFNRDNFITWEKEKKLKIVTHHWGANWNKGFEVYKKIDELLADYYWSGKIEFTYIGNLPKDFYFRNSKHIEPLSGLELSQQLKQNNLYITGSLNEPSGNHHIEAAQCGLPIMYINSGGITEYCKDYGVEFDVNNIEEKLKTVLKNYDYYYQKMKSYPQSHITMCDEYLRLFKKLKNSNNLETRNNIYKNFFYLIYTLKRLAKAFILNEK